MILHPLVRAKILPSMVQWFVENFDYTSGANIKSAGSCVLQKKNKQRHVVYNNMVLREKIKSTRKWTTVDCP